MGDAVGPFVPPWFKTPPDNPSSRYLASVFWGITIAIGIYSTIRSGHLTWRTWKRGHRVTPYVIMIWGEILVSTINGTLCWLHISGYIAMSFWILLGFAILWAFQIQLLLQILITRIGLMMPVRSQVTRLKWTVFIIVLIINISVFVVWIPANLQISHRWQDTNKIWNRIQKVIISIIDILLNISFIYMMRTRLIENGLTKYNLLFRVNICTVMISIALDVILLGLMSIPSKLVYQQFQSIGYLTKLNIEMNIGDMIRKVVLASNIQYGSDQPSNMQSGMSHSITPAFPERNRQRGFSQLSTNWALEESDLAHSTIDGREMDVELEEGNGMGAMQPMSPLRFARRGSIDKIPHKQLQQMSEKNTADTVSSVQSIRTRFPRYRGQPRSLSFDNGLLYNPEYSRDNAF